MELTAKGANKGGMVRRLAELLHVPQANVACVGDHANDISHADAGPAMAFAPANALPDGAALPGVRTPAGLPGRTPSPPSSHGWTKNTDLYIRGKHPERGAFRYFPGHFPNRLQFFS